MVDVIHTDGGILGASISTGTVDFWPNGGAEQPGCIPKNEPLCNHQRSWQFFAESVASPERSFYAVRCDNYKHFRSQYCSQNLPLNNMGIDASTE